MAVPLGSVSVTRQPLIAAPPAVTPTSATKPPAQELATLNAAVQPPVVDGVGDDVRDGVGDAVVREGVGLALDEALGEAVVRLGVGDGLVVGGAPLALVMTT